MASWTIRFDFGNDCLKQIVKDNVEARAHKRSSTMKELTVEVCDN